MPPVLLAGRANPPLAESVAAALGLPPGDCLVEDFPDGELRVEVRQEVQGKDVYLLQPTSPPAAASLLELLLLADACRRRGAARLTAVLPYFGYARQERRVAGTEPVGARLVADLLSCRLDRIVTVDLHDPAVEGFFALPGEHLSAVPLLAQALRRVRSAGMVLVAPDLGAVKLAERYAALLELPVAYLHKVRESGREVRVHRVVGEVRDRTPVVVDDMISTGGTVVSAVEALLAAGCRPQVTVAASHGLLVGDAPQRLARLPLARLFVTDSLPPRDLSLPVEVVGLGELLAATVHRLHAAGG